jgi:hypothetical protein
MSLAHRREPQVIYLVEADLRANRPGRTPAMGSVHEVYEKPFPVSIATDQDADAPRDALGSPLVRPDKVEILCRLPSGFLDLFKDLPAFAPYLNVGGRSARRRGRAARYGSRDLDL